MINSNEERMIIDLSGVLNITELGIKITSILESNNATNKDICLKLGKLDLKQSQLLSIKALVEAMQSKLAVIETTSETTEIAAIGLGLIVGKAKPASTIQTEKTFKLSDDALNTLNKDEEISSFSQLKKLNSIGDFVTDTRTLTEIKEDNVKAENGLQTDEIQNDLLFKTTEPEEVNNALNPTQATSPNDIQNALDVTFGAETRQNITNVNEITENITSEPERDIKEDIFVPIENEEPKEDIFYTSTPTEEVKTYEVTELEEKSDDSKYVLLDTEGITPEGLELIKSNTSDLPTLYLTQTLRSGQTVSYEGNIFLIGDAHPGSEINATGDITVWGILGGIVHAGFKGNVEAKVRALKLNPIQLRIANLYSRRKDNVNVPYVQKTNEFTPEEARIEKEQIVIYKTLRRED